jgi:hypothetical protein
MSLASAAFLKLLFPLGGAKWVIIQAILLSPERKQFIPKTCTFPHYQSFLYERLYICQNYQTQKVQTKWRIGENIIIYACWITLTYWSITTVSKSLQVILFYCIHIPSSKAWLLRLDLLVCITAKHDVSKNLPRAQILDPWIQHMLFLWISVSCYM